MSRSFPREPSSGLAPDHWQILGLTPGADAAALKRAFRAQARRWHPDLNGNDPVAEERFKQVNEAYAVLSDPVRRRAWERGEDLFSGEPADPFASGFPSFEDYLAELDGTSDDRAAGSPPSAGAADPARRRPDGEDQGWSKPQQTDSETTGPRGWVEPSPSPPPPVQVGGDQESLVELTPDQALRGERVELELSDGTVVEVRTPAMAGDGWRLRLAGVAPGGADHFLQLRVRTDDGLRIDGLRVLFQLDLSPAEAVLGAHVVVPTLEGPVRLRVPPGSSSGRLLRLRGRGQRLGERQGDQLVEVRIAVDDQPGEDELALYRRLLELERQRRGEAAEG